MRSCAEHLAALQGSAAAPSSSTGPSTPEGLLAALSRLADAASSAMQSGAGAEGSASTSSSLHSGSMATAVALAAYMLGSTLQYADVDGGVLQYHRMVFHGWSGAHVTLASRLPPGTQVVRSMACQEDQIADHGERAAEGPGAGLLPIGVMVAFLASAQQGALPAKVTRYPCSAPVTHSVRVAVASAQFVRLLPQCQAKLLQPTLLPSAPTCSHGWDWAG